eukprot:4199135-Lingulodinium_polyedra.AAC.1
MDHQCRPCPECGEQYWRESDFAYLSDKGEFAKTDACLIARLKNISNRHERDNMAIQSGLTLACVRCVGQKHGVEYLDDQNRH